MSAPRRRSWQMDFFFPNGSPFLRKPFLAYPLSAGDFRRTQWCHAARHYVLKLSMQYRQALIFTYRDAGLDQFPQHPRKVAILAITFSPSWQMIQSIQIHRLVNSRNMLQREIKDCLIIQTIRVHSALVSNFLLLWYLEVIRYKQIVTPLWAITFWLPSFSSSVASLITDLFRSISLEICSIMHLVRHALHRVDSNKLYLDRYNCL